VCLERGRGRRGSPFFWGGGGAQGVPPSLSQVWESHERPACYVESGDCRRLHASRNAGRVRSRADGGTAPGCHPSCRGKQTSPASAATESAGRRATRFCTPPHPRGARLPHELLEGRESTPSTLVYVPREPAHRTRPADPQLEPPSGQTPAAPFVDLPAYGPGRDWLRLPANAAIELLRRGSSPPRRWC